MGAQSRTPANHPAPPEAGPGPDRAEAVEHRLETLLADPIVQLLMERDGVEREVLLRVARAVRDRAFRQEGSDAPSGN